MSVLAIKGGEKTQKKAWPKWPIVGDKELELIAEVTKSGNWSYNGPMETELRRAWAEYIGVKYAIAVANGTVSLQLAWEALGIGFGDEVIVPGLTWQATAASVADVNAEPVLVDVEEDSWCVDPKAVEAAITPRTKAIAVVHLYGTICNMDAICAIGKKHGIPVVEDSAHQHGSVYKGKKVGAIGAIGSFSLQNSKVFTCGEGGLITTDSIELAEKLDALRNCGRRPVMKEKYENSLGNYVSEGNFIQSGNYRMTEFQAAVLLGQMDRLYEQIALRDANAQYLNQRLAEIDGVRPMRREPGTDVQSYFNFAFRYDRNSFIGLPVQVFRDALSKEMDFPFMPCYEPLNQCELYAPLTKRRHHLSDEYLRAIDPKRIRLPVCERAYHETSVCAHHKLLLGSRSDMDLVADAIIKIKKHADELI
jgi:dTDP-4-amino-4,6-dideoxygalactose transaminase